MENNELLIEIIETIKESAYKQKAEYEKEKDTEQKNLYFYNLIGLVQALSSIKMKIMEWNPSETDEEYNKIYKSFGLDMDLDKEFLL